MQVPANDRYGQLQSLHAGDLFLDAVQPRCARSTTCLLCGHKLARSQQRSNWPCIRDAGDANYSLCAPSRSIIKLGQVLDSANRRLPPMMNTATALQMGPPERSRDSRFATIAKLARTIGGRQAAAASAVAGVAAAVAAVAAAVAFSRHERVRCVRQKQFALLVSHASGVAGSVTPMITSAISLKLLRAGALK